MAGAQQNSMRYESLQQVRLQTFLQHAESGAAAHVGAERARDTRVDVPPQRKQSAAKRRVTARAVGNRSAARSQPLHFGIARMNVVRHHRAAAAELKSLIDIQIVG